MYRTEKVLIADQTLDSHGRKFHIYTRNEDGKARTLARVSCNNEGDPLMWRYLTQDMADLNSMDGHNRVKKHIQMHGEMLQYRHPNFPECNAVTNYPCEWSNTPSSRETECDKCGCNFPTWN